MIVTSEEQYYTRERAKPGPLRAYHEKPDPKNRFTYRTGYDFSTTKSIQGMLDDRLKSRIDPRTGYKILCTMDAIKDKLDANDRSWNAFNSAQVNPKPEMSGRWLDKRNQLRAKRRLCEEECRFLHKLLAEKQAEEKTQREAQKPVGCIKLRDGEPFRVDGRDLMQREDGEYVVKDTGQLLSEYIDQVKAARLKKVGRKRAADATHHRCAAC